METILEILKTVHHFFTENPLGAVLGTFISFILVPVMGYLGKKSYDSYHQYNQDLKNDYKKSLQDKNQTDLQLREKIKVCSYYTERYLKSLRWLLQKFQTLFGGHRDILFLEGQSFKEILKAHNPFIQNNQTAFTVSAYDMAMRIALFYPFCVGILIWGFTSADFKIGNNIVWELTGDIDFLGKAIIWASFFFSLIGFFTLRKETFHIISKLSFFKKTFWVFEVLSCILFLYGITAIVIAIASFAVDTVDTVDTVVAVAVIAVSGVFFISVVVSAADAVVAGVFSGASAGIGASIVVAIATFTSVGNIILLFLFGTIFFVLSISSFKETIPPNSSFKVYGLFWIIGICLNFILAKYTDNNFTRTLILFFSIIPMINGIFDFMSIGITRTMMALQLSHEVKNSRTGFIWYQCLDFAIGLLLTLGLTFVKCVIVLAFSHFIGALDDQGMAVFSISQQIMEAEKDFWNPEYFWIYVSIFSTLLPTLLHYSVTLVGLASHLWFFRDDIEHLNRIQKVIQNPAFTYGPVGLKKDAEILYKIDKRQDNWIFLFLSACLAFCLYCAVIYLILLFGFSWFTGIAATAQSIFE